MKARPFSIWSRPDKKARRDARLAKGLCGCGHPPTLGMKQCAPCREKGLAQYRAQRATQDAPEAPYEAWRPEDELPDADEVVACGR